MAKISGDEIEQFLDLLLQKMLKAGAITPAQKNDIKMVLAPALKDAGGLDPKDPNAVAKLQKGVLDATLVGRVASKDGLTFQNAAAMKEAVGLVALNFKDKLSSEEKRKYTIGMAYLLVLEKNPELQVSMKLALQDPKTLTPTQRKQLSEDLEKIMPLLNAMQVDPKFKLSEEKVDALVGVMKAELAKDPNAIKTPAENKQLMDSMTALFGMDPSTPGKITGPVQCMAGNVLGIADAFPALGAEPIHAYSGDIQNAAMQSATGQYQLDVDRGEDLGEVDTNASKKEAASSDDDGPSAKESLTDSFASMVEEAADEATNGPTANKENIAPKTGAEKAQEKNTIKTDTATPEPEAQKPRTPFDAMKGPRPPQG